MSITRDHYTNVLKFWRAIETFNLPDLPLPFEGHRSKEYSVLEPEDTLPWQSDKFPSLEGDKQWRHTLYFYAVEKESVIDTLAKLSQSKEFREPVSGQTFFSALILNQRGQLIERSYMPAAWIYGKKKKRKYKIRRRTSMPGRMFQGRIDVAPTTRVVYQYHECHRGPTKNIQRIKTLFQV